MEPWSPALIRSHVDRICDSDAFRAAPKLSRVLRCLLDRSLAGDQPVGQRLVAEQALGLFGGSGTTSAVAARMQIGRLRKHLADYYAGEGREEPFRIEVPKRNYRLRVRFLAAARPHPARSRDRATLAVVEFTDIAARPECGWLARGLTHELIVALGPFHRVAVSGPVAPEPVASLLAGGSVPGADFLLTGSVRCDPGEVHIAVQLLDGTTGTQLWATSFASAQGADCGLSPEGHDRLTAIADELADETGAIACLAMQAVASRPPERLSAYDAVLSAWRFLMTGVAEDLVRGHAATAAIAAALPDSPAALVHASMMQFATYLANPDPAAPFPVEGLAAAERAASLAPGDPWVEANRGFALWVTRQLVGLEGICRSLDGRPGSGSFQGMLGSLMAVTAIDLERAEHLLTAGIARAPQPLYWYCHHLALCAFRRGDLDAMQRALARITVRTDPFSLVLRMVLACERGDGDAARGLAAAVLQTLPGFDRCGAVMLRRLLHDDHVDAIAKSLDPLRLGWFG